MTGIDHPTHLSSLPLFYRQLFFQTMATTGISKTTATDSTKQVPSLAVVLEFENGRLAFHSCAPFRSWAAADAGNTKNRVHQSLLFQRKAASIGDGRRWDCASHALSSLPLLLKSL
jgi:hypothetical protein